MTWRRFFQRARWDDERRREMESYVDQETDDNIARGMTPDEARAAARRKLGNATLAREEVYQMNTMGWLDSTTRDLRYGLRVLCRQPTFAIVAVLSLGLGIGANTAIFHLIDTVRLRALPVQEPHTLARVNVNAGDSGRTGRFTSRYAHMTTGIYEYVRDRQQSFSSLAAWGPARLDLSTSGASRPTQGLWVSGNFFATLGVTPALGRLIGPADDTRACEQPVVTISHAFWQRELGGAPDVLGRTVTLDGHVFPIAGVTPSSFFGVEVGRQFDVALPICAERQVTSGPRTALNSPDWWWLAAIGRLKPGVSLEQAGAELRGLSAATFAATEPPDYTTGDAENYRRFVLEPASIATGYSALRGEYNTPLTLLLGLAGLVLLIACGNLANLLLARASAREQEIAVRLAIGASRRRLVRQLMSESLLIAAAGALLGAWIAQNLTTLLVASLSSTRNPIVLDLTVNWRVLAFTAGLGALTCLLFGLVPALRATRTSPASTMRAGGRGLTDGRHRFTLRRGLVVAQLAVSLVLLVGALLFARTLWNLTASQTGFTTEGVVAVDFDLRRSGVAPDDQPAFQARLLERVRALPGIDGATAVAITPMSGSGWNQSIVIDGVVQEGYVFINQVSGNFFSLLDIPLRQGRTFDDRDTLGSPPALIVNDAFVERYFPGVDPLGKTLRFEDRRGADTPLMHVVGVVANTKYRDVREPEGPLMFLAYSQAADPGPSLSTLVRTRQPEQALTRAAVAVANQVNPDILVVATKLTQPIVDGFARERMMATLSSFFGGLALLLAAIGLYGVMSYTVAQRQQEIGIRMALGAGRGRVLSMVLREALLLVIVGVAAGASLSMLAGRSAESLLFGLTATDPITMTAAVAGLALIGVAASAVPAWRASRVEPTTALRR